VTDKQDRKDAEKLKAIQASAQPLSKEELKFIAQKVEETSTKAETGAGAGRFRSLGPG
jgi:hypothetical protein